MTRNEGALTFLRTRRSRPAKLLGPPGPSRKTLEALLEIAARAPDHGKLEPWRFVVLCGAAGTRIADALRARSPAFAGDVRKSADPFERSPVTVAVVASPKASQKIPEIEQTLSAGCVAYGLLNAALASGWGANWLTGAPAYDRDLCETELGLASHEWVASFIHIGTATAVPPERPRPDVPGLTTWMEA